ncbi:MAG: peptidoglycan binding protein CsiV [Gammaproteobacteria bacterium]|nr:peptidoglycan binding protein CsiV [Gammaproteobacteria bacterium]MCF6261095.1 peptidoglycan binding protein CsiV [Gammaproteobacteria bacterium]
MTLINSYHNKNFCRPAYHARAFSLTLMLFLLATLLPMLATAGEKSAPPSLEDARWFQVELILFAQRNGEPLDAEQWPDIEGPTLPDTLLELYLPQDASTAKNQVSTDATIRSSENSLQLPPAYQILGDDALQLTDAVKKLQRSPRFTPLLHIAWQQPTYNRQQAQPIFFMEGMDKPLSVEAGGKITPGTDDKIGPPNPLFVGTVTLSVERYLHLAADLFYRQPVAQQLAIPISDLDLWYDRPYPTLKEPQGPAYRLKSWQAMRGFRLKESRRMRSKKIHYLDHPFMGLVVLITPVELPEDAEEIQQTSPQNILSMPGRQ